MKIPLSQVKIPLNIILNIYTQYRSSVILVTSKRFLSDSHNAIRRGTEWLLRELKIDQDHLALTLQHSYFPLS